MWIAPLYVALVCRKSKQHQRIFLSALAPWIGHPCRRRRCCCEHCKAAAKLQNADLTPDPAKLIVSPDLNVARSERAVPKSEKL